MSIESDLRQSVREETQAVKDYARRGAAARREGDTKTANLYREVGGEEAEHKLEFSEVREDNMTKREKAIKNCVLDLLDGEPMPKGNGQKAKFERCVLKVKCTNKLAGDPKNKRSNPWAVCHASVG